MTISANHRIIFHAGRSTSNEPEWQENEAPAHCTLEAELFVGSKSLGQGLVYITRMRVVFVPADGSSSVLSFTYPSMVMHAVTREEGVKSIFVQLKSDDTGEDEEEEDESPVDDAVLKIRPVDQAQIQALFEAMNEMSALNPDPNDDMDEDYEEFEEDIE